LIACQDQTEETIEAADVDFFGAYGVLQTVTDIRVVKAARVYAYRLQRLEAIGLAKNKTSGGLWPRISSRNMSERLATARQKTRSYPRRESHSPPCVVAREETLARASIVNSLEKGMTTAELGGLPPAAPRLAASYLPENTKRRWPNRPLY
jgi:hypothetical protein